MMHFKPRKLIDKNSINNIDQYSNQIKKYPIIEKFMWHILMKWIKTLPNPLEIPWIYQLYENRIGYLEKFLQQMASQIGEENLKLCLQELYLENTKAEDDLFRKIQSIEAELMTFSQLKESGHKNLRKISEIGDIESETAIISVKAILDFDINYRIMENIIWGLIIIEENEVLRNFDFIRFSNEENIDYKFLKNLINFLEGSLISSLEFLSSGDMSNFLNIEIHKSIYRKRQYEGLFKVKIIRLPEDSNDCIYFYIEEKRVGKERKHRIDIKVEKDHNQQSDYFYVDYDKNVFGEGEKITNQFLKHSITSKLGQIDKNSDKVTNDKCYIGWINLSVSPMHENYVLGNDEEIKNLIKRIEFKKDYQKFLSLTPQLGFNLKEPKLIEL